MKHSSQPIVVLIALAFLSLHGIAGEPKPEDRARVWEQYAIQAYSNLNARLNGNLTPIFRSLGDFGELHEYFDQDSNPEKYETYRQFLVQVFADAMRGDVGEAMFANVLLELTPPNVLLPMIAPEIGLDGRLQGVLDGENSDVAKRIERRSQIAYAGNVNFDYYVSYLKGKKNRGYASQTNADIIVEHMFRMEPQRAFTSMLWADYGFLPYARGNCYLYCGKDTEEVRRLQQAHAVISDFLFRCNYSFPIEDGQEKAVKDLLRQLSLHEKSWIRLFVVCLMEKERNLRFSAILDPLAKDSDERVRNAVARIKKEYPPWQEKPTEGK